MRRGAFGGGVGPTAVAQETDLRDRRARLRLGDKRRQQDVKGEPDENLNRAEPHDDRPMSASRMPLIAVNTADIAAHMISFTAEVAER
jgi:hypothetical protein